jgi:branched-chain amino acid transport system substrate-binding protein
VHKRRWIPLLAVIAVAATAAGCGSSSKSSSTSSASSGGTTTGASANVSGSPIVVGSICSCTGAEAPSIGGVKQTLDAWVSYTNANGGINGHPVKLILLDDGSNATTSAQQAKQLVEQDHVQAIVAEMSLNDGTWASYVQSKGVPVVGAANYNAVFLTNPDFFSTGGQTPALTYGVEAEAKAAGKTKLGVLPCAEAPACTAFAGLFQALAPIVGVQIAYTAKITVTQPTYTATCLAAQGKGVNAMVVLENAATVIRVADQCAQQGYKPTQFNLSGTAGLDWGKDPNLDGATVIESNPVIADASIPATQTRNQALQQYGSGLTTSSDYNELDAQAWAGAEAFKVAAQRAKLTPTTTPADVLNGLYTFKNETVGGLTPPLTYVKGQPSSVPCYFITVVKGGKYTAPQGANPTCIPAADQQKIATALKG